MASEDPLDVEPIQKKKTVEKTADKENKPKEPILFATVQEGRARPVEWNQRFHHFIMNKQGHTFKGRLPNSNLDICKTEYWEVVPDTRQPRKYNLFEKWLLVPSYQGLYYIGIPGTAKIPRNRFGWIEFNYAKQPDGTISNKKAPIPHEEMISHILVQPDVYFVSIDAAETKEGVPVTVNLLLTMEVVNTYKARYGVQNWLEAVTNQAEANVRRYVGSQEVLQMLTVDVADATTSVPIGMTQEAREQIEGILKNEMRHIEQEYGVAIRIAQVQSVEIVGPDAAQYREAVTTEFTARAAAKKLGIQTEAEAKRITDLGVAEAGKFNAIIAAIATSPIGPQVLAWLKIPESKLVYYGGTGQSPTPLIPLPPQNP